MGVGASASNNPRVQLAGFCAKVFSYLHPLDKTWAMRLVVGFQDSGKEHVRNVSGLNAGDKLRGYWVVQNLIK